MSISAILGPVDANSALVMAAFCIGMAVIITTLIIKRRSRLEINNDFALAKIKLQDDRDFKALAAANSHDVEIKKIEQGLITSHRQD